MTVQCQEVSLFRENGAGWRPLQVGGENDRMTRWWWSREGTHTHTHAQSIYTNTIYKHAHTHTINLHQHRVRVRVTHTHSSGVPPLPLQHLVLTFPLPVCTSSYSVP